jgi:cysteine desulfurase
MQVYLDNSATTKPDKKVIKEILSFYQKNYANPSSIHFSGQKNYVILEKARERIAKNLGTSSDRIIFTSGATESNNFILSGVMRANQQKGKHLIISSIEHPSVYQTSLALAKEGYEVDFLPVNKKGIVKIEELKKLLKKSTVLVSVMSANNEIGTIQPIEEIAKIVKKNNSYFHSDLTQSIAYRDINIDNLFLDFASLSAHKFHGPTGVGLAIINSQVKIKPLIIGGEQENSLRSGTYNLADIIGLDIALDIAVKNRQENVKKIKELRNYFWHNLKKEIKGVSVNGCMRRRLVNNLNVLFSGVEGEAILIDLSDKGIEVSTGSACSASNLKSSYVLSAIGLKDDNLNSNIRFSLSKDNTKEELDYTIKKLKIIINRLRSFSPIK